MKLIYCEYCADIFALTEKNKNCHCGQSSGHYIDNKNVEVSGKSIVFGIRNPNMTKLLVGYKFALKNNIQEFFMSSVELFIIPEPHKTIKRI